MNETYLEDLEYGTHGTVKEAILRHQLEDDPLVRAELWEIDDFIRHVLDSHPLMIRTYWLGLMPWFRQWWNSLFRKRGCFPVCEEDGEDYKFAWFRVRGSLVERVEDWKKMKFDEALYLESVKFVKRSEATCLPLKIGR